MKHIKLFQTENEFLIESQNLPSPCVSYTVESDTVRYYKNGEKKWGLIINWEPDSSSIGGLSNTIIPLYVKNLSDITELELDGQSIDLSNVSYSPDFNVYASSDRHLTMIE